MPDASGGGGGGGGGGGDGGGGSDSGGGTPGTAPGGMCSCDADCADEGAIQGVCIYGVCMTKVTAACASGGSQGECPTGSRCWTLDGSSFGPAAFLSNGFCLGDCPNTGKTLPGRDLRVHRVREQQ